MRYLIIIAVTTAMFIVNMSVYAKNIVIGAPMSSMSDKWLTYLQKGIIEFDNEHDDVEIILLDANEDSKKMLSDVDSLIKQGVDALLVIPTESSIVISIAKKANKAKIPLIIVNRLPEEKAMKYVNSYIGSESIEAGIIQAERVIKVLGDKEAKVGLLLGALGHEAQAERTAGNKQVFERFKNVKIVMEQEAGWSRTKAEEITENWLKADKSINVIVANNDEMAIGALLAANKLGIKDEDIIIAGIDATPDALELLGAGLDVSVFQPAYEQGHKGAEIAFKLANKEPVKKYNWLPFEPVVFETKAEYLKRYEHR